MVRSDVERFDAPQAGAAEASALDRALVGRLQRGEGAAFEELVRSHGGPMLSVARRILRSEEEAKDALQEAFLSAWRSIDRYTGEARLATWLHRIAVNAALMRLRRQKKQRESSIDDLLPQFAEDGHRANPGPAWVACAEAQLVREESNRMIRRAIDRLPDAYRTVLMLRDIEDLDGSETAAALGTTPNAVKVRLHRARMALRTLLEPMMTGERVREDR